jgi:tetratricopeptide (TPR) repeat protein
MIDVQQSLTNSVHALARGDVEAAMRMASGAVERHPGLSVAHLVLGRAQLAGQRTADAVATLRAALWLDPNSAEIHASLASALAAQGLVREPLELFVRAIELAPTAPDVQTRAAHFMLEQGHLDEAFHLYRAATDQGSADGLAGLLSVLERRGEITQAIALLDENAEAVEASESIALAAARLWHRVERFDEARQTLERVLSKSPTPGVRVPVLHLLGEVLEKEFRYDAAFAAWREANELRGLRFDVAALRERVDGLIEQSSPQALKRLPKASTDSERPIFIVGMPRSGTSLVEQILSQHPSISGAGELELLGEIASRIDRHSPSDIDRASNSALETLSRQDENAERIIDKMPHNWLHLGLVAQILPGARIIHCVRDPLDTCLSCYAKNFAATHDYATGLEALGQFRREHEVVRQLIEFCGLPWNPELLRFHESKRAIATASYDQVRRPLYTTSVGRASHFAAHLGPLEAVLKG